MPTVCIVLYKIKGDYTDAKQLNARGLGSCWQTFFLLSFVSLFLLFFFALLVFIVVLLSFLALFVVSCYLFLSTCFSLWAPLTKATTCGYQVI